MWLGAESCLLLAVFQAVFSSCVGGYVSRYDLRTAPGMSASDSDCRQEFASVYGTIESPNYPAKYDNNKACVWVVHIPDGSYIHFDLKAFRTRGREDYLKVFLGGEGSTRSRYTLSGWIGPTSADLHNIQTVTLVFMSDRKKRAWGFSVDFEVITPTTLAPPTTVAPPSCGVPAITRAPWSKQGDKIVGGNDAVPGSWPWQVSLRSFDDGIGHFCGGTLVAPEWVVTAAHCVDDMILPYVALGEHDRTVTESHEVSILASAIILHPGWDTNTKDNDIALLKLSSPVTYTDHISPACLPDRSSPIPNPGTLCTISGWGTTSEGGSSSNVLLQAEMPIVQDSVCQAVYDWIKSQLPDWPTYNGTNMFCAGYTEGGVDTCQGDSGGPFICQSSDTGAYVLQGVVSWGYGCARQNIPGNYARMPGALVDWVNQVMDNNP